jgi:hypothetical protein
MKRKSLIGERFGSMVVIDQLENDKKNRNWLVMCDCGTICEKNTYLLKNTKSCGCLRKKVLSGRRKIQENQKFGFLTTQKISRRGYWTCLCFCGNVVDVRSQYLIKGTTKSCGCMSSQLRNDSYYKNKPTNINIKKLKYVQEKYYPNLTVEEVLLKLKGGLDVS